MSEHTCLRHIPWETRNLARKSFAVTEEFLDNPDPALLQEAIAAETHEHGSIFIQARLGKHDGLAALLGRAGFYFVETALVPYCVLKKSQVLKRFRGDSGSFLPARYALDTLEFRTLDRSDAALCAAVEEIAGESFSDDRFHVDPNCSREIADGRYSYWTADLLRDEVVSFTILLLSGKAIAFMARNGGNLLLAGFARQYVNSGLGDFFWLSVLDQMAGEGVAQATSMISANNTAVLNLYARIGFKFRDPAATFHYWSDSSRPDDPKRGS